MSFSQLINQSLTKPSPSIRRYVNQCISQASLFMWTFNQFVNQSINSSDTRSITLISVTINQSITVSIDLAIDNSCFFRLNFAPVVSRCGTEKVYNTHLYTFIKISSQAKFIDKHNMKKALLVIAATIAANQICGATDDHSTTLPDSLSPSLTLCLTPPHVPLLPLAQLVD